MILLDKIAIAILEKDRRMDMYKADSALGVTCRESLANEGSRIRPVAFQSSTPPGGYWSRRDPSAGKGGIQQRACQPANVLFVGKTPTQTSRCPSEEKVKT